MLLYGSGNLVPADKKLYALRDVTGTVDSIPLIASSIMSKKLAAGSDVIVLDVKYGSGAFMKTPEEAVQLAQTMIDIGTGAGRKVRAVISSMEAPLGRAVGNALEVREAVETLAGRGPSDLKELCMTAGALILQEAGICRDTQEARQMLKEKTEDGSALEKLAQMVRAQGGDDEDGHHSGAKRLGNRHQCDADRPTCHSAGSRTRAQRRCHFAGCRYCTAG